METAPLLAQQRHAVKEFIPQCAELLTRPRLFRVRPEPGAGRLCVVSPGQRAEANSPGLDHHKIAEEPVSVRGNDGRYGIGLQRVRETIQFQKDNAAQAEALANDHFAKIAVLGNQNPAVRLCRVENVLIRSRPVSSLRSKSRHGRCFEAVR